MQAANETDPVIGNAISLDHVNFRVPDYGLATAFFVVGLGLTRDPYRMVGIDNCWVNIGKQQFHLQHGPSTPFEGEVGLLVPDLNQIRANFHGVRSALEGTSFSIREENGGMLTTCPWGKRIRLHEAGSLPGMLPIGLAYLEIWVREGTSERIGAFYREILECPAETLVQNGAPALHVGVGPYQTLRFVEKSGLKLDAHTNHAALYVTNYDRIHAALKARGLVEDEQIHQFRFFDIFDPDSGEVLHRFEHEVRNLYHPDFYRKLANRALYAD